MQTTNRPLFNIEDVDDNNTFNFEDDEDSDDSDGEHETKNENKEKNVKIFPKLNEVGLLSESTFIENIETDVDNQQLSHRILYKGSEVNLSKIKFFHCTKLKVKNKVLGFFGISGSKEVPHFVFINEYFIYFLKEHKTNENTGVVGNNYNLKKLSNIIIDDYQSKKMIVLSFTENVHTIDSEVKSKTVYFDPKLAKDFYSYFRTYLEKLNIPIQSNNY
jgi:hypothetical protein